MTEDVWYSKKKSEVHGKNNPYFTQRMMDFKLVFTTQEVLELLQVAP